MTIASSCDGATRCSCSVASASMRFGDRSVSISSRRWRAGFLLGGALALHLLEPVAVPQQLEVLPGREQQDEHEERRDADRLPELALPRLVHFPDDRVVANVLLDRVFEGFSHALAAILIRSRSAARSFALRARGFVAHFVVARHDGFFVST